MGHGLSREEKEILIHINDETKYWERRVKELRQAVADSPYPTKRHPADSLLPPLAYDLALAEQHLHWGVSWPRLPRSRSEDSSRSRSLRRLEQRGLVLRQSYVHGKLRRSQEDPHGRTTHVQLTPEGRSMVSRP
jgi:hypothetical protein